VHLHAGLEEVQLSLPALGRAVARRRAEAQHRARRAGVGAEVRGDAGALAILGVGCAPARESGIEPHNVLHGLPRR
jgi:hypothetical protein